MKLKLKVLAAVLVLMTAISGLSEDLILPQDMSADSFYSESEVNMPNIPQIKIGSTTYDLHDKRVDDLKSALSAVIRSKDCTKLTYAISTALAQSGMMFPLMDLSFAPISIGGMDFNLLSFDGYVWARTPLFRVYKGQKIVAGPTGTHIIFCNAVDFSNTAYDKKTISANNVLIVDEDTYASIGVPLNPQASLDDVQATIIGIPTGTYHFFYEDEPLINEFVGIEEVKYYKSNGLYTYGSETVHRGVAHPYDGHILYRDNPTERSVIPIAIATNGTNPYGSCHLNLEVCPGESQGYISLNWSLDNRGYSSDLLTFDHAFPGNINGISVSISNNVLTISYIYEGEIVQNTANVGPYIQMIYDRMEHVTGHVAATGTSPNIWYYGKGFQDYNEYYRFAKDLNDDSQIASHELRIQNLEDGSGGGGTPVDFDWAKGYDLLEFGQEYLYAWLNALNGGSSFKVLFTGDSTTAYYDGTANGLKEILQACMANVGYSNGVYVNRAVSGINATTWLNSHLAGDIAEAPTLYIIRYGFNNEAGETEDEMATAFQTTMNSALSQIRGSLPVSRCSIILMMPNTSDDEANHRGQSMKKKLEPIVRQLARAYGCGFIDTFRTWYDPGTYADPMYDDPYGDHRSIHPNGLMNRLIISKLFDFICPAAYRLNDGD